MPGSLKIEILDDFLSLPHDVPVKSSKNVAVIGAGPAGMTAAYELAKRGINVQVFEASNSVGGMAKSFDLWGQRVDLGPHRFFSSDARINRLWLEVVGRDYKMVDRLTRIYYKRRFFLYPLKAFDALANLGIFEAVRCVLSYLREKFFPTSKVDVATPSFEDWVVSRFGRRLFSIFFKTYSEKLWGISCTELDADFAAQRIKKLDLYEAIKAALFSGGGKKHKTLVDRFAFPIRGTGEAYERMATFVKESGGSVRLESPVFSVSPHSNGVTVRLENGTLQEFDEVITSMPLTEMVKRLPDVPADVTAACDQLKFRNTILVYLRVEADGLFPDNWLYVHSPDLKMGRVTNFSNWIPEIRNGKKDSILALEYWCNDQDSEWTQKDDELIELAKKEIVSTGLVGKASIPEGKVIRVRRCYPVYARGYRMPLEKVVGYLKTVKRVHPIGRYGSFKYNNQDHSILMGLLVAENLAEGKNHDLWQINTDYETYQESATIDETGLQLASAL